jgi:hypothetical protein
METNPQELSSGEWRGQHTTTHAEMKANVEFTVNGKPIEKVEEFEYLGRVVTKHDKDEPAVRESWRERGRSGPARGGS